MPSVSTVQCQLIVIGNLANAAMVDLVADLAHRAEQRIHRHEADRGVRRAVLRSPHVTFAGFDGQFHIQLGAFIERADHMILVDDFNIMRAFDHRSGHFARAGGLQRQALLFGAMRLDAQFLDVEDDIGHVFTNARQRRRTHAARRRS